MSINDIRERCYLDDHGCWLWRGAATKGVPRICASTAGHAEKRNISGYKAAWLLNGGKVPEGHIVYRVKCRDTYCVNPYHYTCGTRADWGAHLRKTGYLRGCPIRAVINKANSAAGAFKSKVTPELAREIRESKERGCDIAKRLGLSETTISTYRSGKARRVTVLSANSVFTFRADMPEAA